MTINLAGQVAVVIGGTGGFGRGACLGLAERGASVVVNARSQERIDELVETIKSKGGHAVGIAESVITLDSAQMVIAKAVEAFGHVDTLVNCAGHAMDHSILKTTWEEWQAMIDVELMSAFAGVKAAADHMATSGFGGSIITVAGHGGIYGMAGSSGHAAAKGGVIAATWGWAEELIKHGITVNCIRGRVDSVISRDGMSRYYAKESKTKTPREIKFYEPQESAPLIVWLASSEARDITGRCIGIDGPRIQIWEPKPPDTEIFTSLPSWNADALGEALGPAIRRRPPKASYKDFM